MTVKNVQTSCDSPLGAVTFYARSGNKVSPTTAPTAIATEILVPTGHGMTTNDLVIYVWANGTTPVCRTVSDCTTTSITVVAIGTVGTTSDKIYEVSAQGKIIVAGNSAAAGTNTLGNYPGDLFSTPGDSPLYVTMASVTNTCLQVTVQK
jgi:hypothetical protein